MNEDHAGVLMRWAFWRDQSPRGQDDRGNQGSDPAAGALRVRAVARRRLIGAAALLLAVVIVVPLLFDPTPRPIADNIPIEIPSDKTPFAPRLSLPQTPESGAPAAPGVPPSDLVEPDSATAAATAPPASAGSATGAAPPMPRLPDTAAATAAAPMPAASTTATATAAPAVAAPAAAESRARSAAAAPPVGAARSRPSSSAADAALARGLLEGRRANPGSSAAVARAATIDVQVAALASETAAQELSDRLRGNGFSPFTERTETRDGLRFRVRVGPFGNRDEAERARARLRALGVEANLVAP
jgi:DedD protein